MADDLVGVLGPGERVGPVVPAVDVAGDRGFEVGNAVERAAADGLAGDDPEEDLDHVQPGPGRGGEVQVDAGVLDQPGTHVGVLVRRVVVADHVQLDPGVGLGDLLEEGEELDVGVLLEAPVGHQPGRDLERREEGRGAVALVVVGLLLRDPRPQGKDRRGPVQGLDLGLLVDADDDGLRGWVEVQPDDVADLGLELGVRAELERLGLPWLQTPPTPDPRDRREADPEVVGQQASRPVRHPQLLRRRFQRGRDDDLLVVDRRPPRPG